MKKLFFLIAIIFLSNSMLQAMSFRVNQIPNGSKFSCANCHVSPFGGGARNDFGKLVEQKYLDQNGNVIWNNAIANEDADGDGFTNGQELQDPNGIWKEGQPNPGNANNVYNPGDKNSKPLGTSIADLEINYSYKLDQNYPNPFNPTTQISYQIQDESYVTLKIYDIIGNEISSLVNKIHSKGNYTIKFDATNLASGVYFYQLLARSINDEKKFFIENKKMILSK